MTERSSSPQSTSREQQPPAKGISRAQIRDILAECEGVELPDPGDDDTLLVLDSYTAIWIQHLLEERHGIVVRISGETAGIDSMSALQALVNRSLGAGHP
uniref:Carrier domain-containing protein n=1 Tax=Streptomyces sp. NBC_01401 TaxID=2903854 RepID=A0AAU3GPT0_9ACTN